eukprot:TRINITY_DN5221_c0_g1_i4.p1 TRINITY_DN5221_c0_g1~~TRINITY_DN5221_c0_g1_i4.p1  ORF type:complete len:545 (-),score=44.86 TRINITY_DN5221_c0_g1_i4:567-2201(-)
MRSIACLRFALIGSLTVDFARGHCQSQNSEACYVESSLPSGSLDLTRAGDDDEPLINDDGNDVTMLLQTRSGRATGPQHLFHVDNSTRVTGQFQIPVTNGSLFVVDQTSIASSGSALHVKDSTKVTDQAEIPVTNWSHLVPASKNCYHFSSPLFNDDGNDATILLQTYHRRSEEPPSLLHVNESTRVTGQFQIPVTNGSLFVVNQTSIANSGSALNLANGNTSGSSFKESLKFSSPLRTHGANLLDTTRRAVVLDRRMIFATFLVFLCVFLCAVICRQIASVPTSTTGEPENPTPQVTCARSEPSLPRSSNALCGAAGLDALTAMSEIRTEASLRGVPQHPSSTEIFPRTSTLPSIAAQMPVRFPDWLHDDLVVPSDRKVLVVLPEESDFETNSFIPVRNRLGTLVFTIKMEQNMATQQRRLVLQDGLGSSAFGFYTFDSLPEGVTKLFNQTGEIIGDLRLFRASTFPPLRSYILKMLSGSILLFVGNSIGDLNVTEPNKNDASARVQPEFGGSAQRAVAIGPGMDAGLIILSVVCIEWLWCNG